MTGKVREKRLAYLEQRRMVAAMNTLRWAKYTMQLLEQQIDLAKEGLMRDQMAERIRKLRAQGLMGIAKEERDVVLRKHLGMEA